MEQLSPVLISKQLKVVTVESCTAGWIGKALTDLAGSSQWFDGGLITYSNESKHHLVDVSYDLLETHGAVSLPVVKAMAQGAQKHFKGCISVAVSGVAGPDGGSKEKPVGTVCIATCLDNSVHIKQFRFKGNRDKVRQQTVEQALQMVLDVIK